MVLRGLSLPFSASRLAVLGVSAFTVTLTGVFWYQRAFNANPMRLAKDADGVYRYMTKADLLRIKVNEAEANYSMDKDNEHYAMMLRVWKTALDEEIKRLHEAGIDVSEYTDGQLVSTAPKFKDALDKAFETTENNLRSFSGIGLTKELSQGLSSGSKSQSPHLQLDEEANL